MHIEGNTTLLKKELMKLGFEFEHVFQKVYVKYIQQQSIVLKIWLYVLNSYLRKVTNL